MRSGYDDNNDVDAKVDSESTNRSWPSAFKESVLYPVGNILKTKALPTLISAGRIVPSILISGGRIASSMGNGLFILPKSYKILTGKDSDGSRLIYWLSIMFIFCSLIVQLATRVPSIFHQFRNKKTKAESQVELQSSASDIESEIAVNESTQSKLGYIGTAIYSLLSLWTLGSAFMTIPNNYLGGDSLADFSLTEAKQDPNSDHWKLWVMGFAAFIAFSSFANYLIFNVKKGCSNAKKIGGKIENKDVPLDVVTAITIGVSVAGTVTVPCSSLFSTENAFQTIFENKEFSGKSTLITALSFFSASTALISQITTQPADVYALIKKIANSEKSPKNKFKHPKLITALTILVYFAGIYCDFGVWALSNYTGVKNTFQTKFNVNTSSYSFIAANLFCTLNAAVLNYCFSIIGGWKNTLDVNFAIEPQDDAKDIASSSLLAGEEKVVSDQPPPERGSAPILKSAPGKDSGRSYSIAAESRQTFFEEQDAARKLSKKDFEDEQRKDSLELTMFSGDKGDPEFNKIMKKTESDHHLYERRDERRKNRKSNNKDALVHGYRSLIMTNP